MTSSRPLRAFALPACAFAMTALTACGPDYGSNFDYPNEPPLPPGASVITDAKGWDDDDPMRGREVVIDTGSSQPAELREFYRERFTSTEGWLPGTPDPDVGGGHLLCLVSHSDKRFDEYLEIYPYDRASESAGPHRYQVSISRLYVKPGRDDRSVDRCGLAGIWFPADQ